MGLYELWHRKSTRDANEFDIGEAGMWGSTLEASIADGIAKIHKLDIQKIEEYIELPELRLGSSFDFEYFDGFKTGILEIKNVSSMIFQNNWIDQESDTEAPPHIELQCQHEMLVSGHEHLKLGVLVGGNKSYVLDRKPNEKIFKLILEKAAAFWKSIDEDKPPAPNFKTDSAYILETLQFVDSGKAVELGTEAEKAARKYTRASRLEKKINQIKDEAKARILMEMNDAEKGFHENFKVSAGMVKESVVSYTRKPYRSFRLTEKVNKGE